MKIKSLISNTGVILLLSILTACPKVEPEPTLDPKQAPVDSAPINAYPTVTVSTVAGRNSQNINGGFVDGKGQDAQFKYPGQIAIDKFDNLYIIDQGMFSDDAKVIRKMDPAGNVTTFASGFTSVADICIDPRDGTTLYAVDDAYYWSPRVCAIYRIDASGQKTKITGGPDRIGYKDGSLAEAMFKLPSGIAMDKAGNLYVADAGNYCVRKINLTTGIVSTLAGHPFDINTQYSGNLLN